MVFGEYWWCVVGRVVWWVQLIMKSGWLYLMVWLFLMRIFLIMLVLFDLILLSSFIVLMMQIVWFFLIVLLVCMNGLVFGDGV